MLRMIKFELAKLFHSGVVLGAIAVLLLIDIWLQFNFCFGSATCKAVLPDGKELTGRKAVAYNQSIAEKYAGNLTDETISQMVSDMAKAYPKKYAEIISDDRIFDELPTTYQRAAVFIPSKHYKESLQKASEKGIIVPQFNQYGLISMHDVGFTLLNQPLKYGFWDSWYWFISEYGSSSASIAIPALIVIIIAISTIFSNEYSLKMDALILTTRFGKNRQIIAKLLTCTAFSTLIVVGLFAMNCVAYGWQYGLNGWNADIQTNLGFSFYGALIRMNNLQFVFFALLLTWLAAIFTSGFTAALSAITKTPFTTLIISLAAFVLPAIVKQMVAERTIRDSMIVFPINAVNSPEIISIHTDTNSIFYKQPFAPLQWIIVASITVMILSSVVAYKTFKSHQVTG